MKSHVIGRNEEWQRIEECMQANTAQLIIVYGRRRAGKTFPVNEFFDNEFAFMLTGAYHQPTDYQLRSFIAEYNRRTGEKPDMPKDWVQALEYLRKYLSSIAANGKKSYSSTKCRGWIPQSPDFRMRLNGSGMTGVCMQ